MKSKEMIRAQETLTGEIFVDNFAGGGGASTGIELALGRIVNIAVNHDPAAILMHKTNHPYTEHYQASVWDIDPREICRDRPVAGAWFSPDCKHFSKAKGAALVDKRIRGLAWITLRWAALVRPHVIFLENVEEFQTWGPVRKGKPVKKLAGTTFRKFIGQLQELGYTVEWRELVAADYGAPTTRKRFFLIARRDGQPIVWPEPTHAPADSPKVKAGTKKPWRSAAEIIDWSLPTPSIFATREEIKARYGIAARRPLRPNTMRRVARGVDKFVIKSTAPFIVNHAGEFRGQEIGDPLQTITAKHGYGVASPVMAPVTLTNTTGSAGAQASNPVHTVTSAGNQALTEAVLAPLTMHNNENAVGTCITDPVNTITSSGAGGHQMPITPAMIQYHTEQSERVRGQGVTDPLMTIDASNRYGLTASTMVKYYGTDQHGQNVQDSLHTVTAKDREGLVAVSLSKFYGGVVGAAPADPIPTVTAIDHNALQTAHLVKMKGTNLGGPATEPVQTVTAGGGHHGVVTTRICKTEPGADLQNWPAIRDLLNTHCGYHLEDNEVILFSIGGAWYFMADIGLRMLTPRELYNAMGFPLDYIIDRDYAGKPYPKKEQVARCGNAVCPPMAAAVVAAQFPEYAVKHRITTMEELVQEVAV